MSAKTVIFFLVSFIAVTSKIYAAAMPALDNQEQHPAEKLDTKLTTVTFCNDEGVTPYPNPTGWQDFAYCDLKTMHLYMLVEAQIRNKACQHKALGQVWEVSACKPFITKYKSVSILDGNYSRKNTGLACNIAVYKCDIERY